MNTHHPITVEENAVKNLPRAHEWEVVAGFAMQMAADREDPQECMLEPAVQSLKTYGLEEAQLRQMCAEVEHTGEELRQDCLCGGVGYVSVRVLISTQSTRSTTSGTWRYYVLKEIASSESDSLGGIEDPRCFIDLHVYREGSG